MFARLSTAFVVVLGLMTLVNAGTVPVARAVYDLDKRNYVARGANYEVLQQVAREETPEPDPGKPEPDPGKPEPDPGKPTPDTTKE
ncbi:hypothetical protein DEU56DRAFT_910816 [Suillus clintonianus]|uniref:uncharacterized protein n=1 Tax=Suillus clintonianus TaxID=1904413 RepID=UPI001B86F4F4|nr:uncharacterized protein DEU56DRAFT_910816 [Suillus clintonianus]KAG2143687.1 hypothetical protein DEU56DRAFT_910816 [Suillus clintonianus]